MSEALLARLGSSRTTPRPLTIIAASPCNFAPSEKRAQGDLRPSSSPLVIETRKDSPFCGTSLSVLLTATSIEVDQAGLVGFVNFVSDPDKGTTAINLSGHTAFLVSPNPDEVWVVVVNRPVQETCYPGSCLPTGDIRALLGNSGSRELASYR